MLKSGSSLASSAKSITNLGNSTFCYKINNNNNNHTKESDMSATIDAFAYMFSFWAAVWVYLASDALAKALSCALLKVKIAKFSVRFDRFFMPRVEIANYNKLSKRMKVFIEVFAQILQISIVVFVIAGLARSQLFYAAMFSPPTATTTEPKSLTVLFSALLDTAGVFGGILKFTRFLSLISLPLVIWIRFWIIISILLSGRAEEKDEQLVEKDITIAIRLDYLFILLLTIVILMVLASQYAIRGF